MAWENYNVEEQRSQLISAYIAKSSSMADLCKQYGISRKTAYKWYQRFLELGEAGLKDLPKAPRMPNHFYTNDQIDKLIDLKLKKELGNQKRFWASLKNGIQMRSGHQLQDCMKFLKSIISSQAGS